MQVRIAKTAAIARVREQIAAINAKNEEAEAQFHREMETFRQDMTRLLGMTDEEIASTEIYYHPTRPIQFSTRQLQVKLDLMAASTRTTVLMDETDWSN